MRLRNSSGSLSGVEHRQKTLPCSGHSIAHSFQSALISPSPKNFPGGFTEHHSEATSNDHGERVIIVIHQMRVVAVANVAG
jgi:hypothetical protein